MALYESEHTKFMREWMEKHPEEIEVQKTGRAMWWDKPPLDVDTRQLHESNVPQKPYYYDLK